MKARIFLLFIVIGLTFFSCKKEAKPDEIQLRWEEFLNVVEQKNIPEFKKFTNDTIRCYMCIENTDHERKVLEYLRENDTTWYDKLYDEKIYLPINKFIEEDFNLIFTKEFVELLKTRKTIFSEREINGINAYEILITTTKPVLGHEGGQHDFQFKKEDGVYKLFEISTIP